MDQELKRKFNSLGVVGNVQFCEVSLAQLPREIATAQLYIGNDTGIKHLSIALGLKSISFFGPEPPEEWHPYDKSEHPFFYIDPLDCRTEKAHFCGLSTCESMICLNQFTPDSVYQEFENFWES